MLKIPNTLVKVVAEAAKEVVKVLIKKGMKK